MQRLLSLSPRIEQGIIAACVVAAIYLGARGARSTAGSVSRLDTSLGTAAEVYCLFLIVAAAMALRIVGHTAPGEPRWWFSASTTLWAARALETGDLWKQWLGLLRTTQVQSLDRSAIMMPVSVAFQALLGPSWHLPQIVGAFWGTLTVVMAWLAGRAIVSPAFGLAFGAFVACTPLQVVWSRLGFMAIGAGAHVLFVLWLAYRAGTRRSTAVAVIAAAAAGVTVYGYQAARIAIPLGGVALFAGLRRGRASTRDYIRIAATLGFIVALTIGVFGSERVCSALWPHYHGYVGARGEDSARAFLRTAVETLQTQSRTALRSYFWVGRLVDRGAIDRFEWGMASGGLCLLPVGALGIIGLAATLNRWRQGYLWILFAALGMALPFLSLPTARRFLLFDIGWCALAAFGLLALCDSRWLSGFSRRARDACAVAFVALLGAWTAVTVAALNADLPDRPYTEIPFGESGHWDGRVCLGCVRSAHRWQHDIEQDNLLVLFDSDPDREQRGIPAGLPLFGRLAALSARKPDHFVDFYAIAQNFDIEPPRVGPIFDPAQASFASFLADRIEAAAAASIVWHFERPTQWERSVAEELEALAGTRTTLERRSLVMFEDSNDHPIEVRTPWSRRREAIELLTRRTGTRSPPVKNCIEPERVRAESHTREVLALGALPSPQAPPQWAIGTFSGVEYQGRSFSTLEPKALSASSPGESPERLYVLNHGGGYEPHDLSPGVTPPAAPGPIRRNCAARVGDDWWVVDPVSGTLSTSAAPAIPLPPGPWIGIAAHHSRTVILAAADQTLTVLNTADLAARRTFAAAVPPSRRFHFGECTRIVAGHGWIATFNHLLGRLLVYDPKGTLLASLALDELLGVHPYVITEVAARDDYLGVAHGAPAAGGTQVTTLRMTRADDCDEHSWTDRVFKTHATRIE